MRSTQPTLESASDLRAEIARQMTPLYRLAPRVGLHPTHLGQVLRERRPLSPGLAERIKHALSELDPGDQHAAA